MERLIPESQFGRDQDALEQVNASDKTLMQKLKLLESLEEDERKALYTMLDAFISKRRLRQALSEAIKLT